MSNRVAYVPGTSSVSYAVANWPYVFDVSKSPAFTRAASLIPSDSADVYVGHSFGALVAQELAKQRHARAVLVGAPYGGGIKHWDDVVSVFNVSAVSVPGHGHGVAGY